MAITDVVIAVVSIKIIFFVSLNLCQDPTDEYHGCYFDGVDRALQDLITCADGMGVCQESCGNEQTYCEGETGMTVDFCRVLCRNRNLQYYALQSGNQCFCGGALSNPFTYTEYKENLLNCSYPCSGDANQTCGGDFKMQVYEINEPVPGADCFRPGFVPNSYASDNLLPKVGEKVTYLCEPGHMIIGEPQLTCQTQRAWSPNVLPVCNFTGIFPETPPTETPEPTPSTITVSTKKDIVIPTTPSFKDATPTSNSSLLYVGILIGVAASIVTALFILFIAKRRHKRRNEGTQPPDPNRNPSTVVNPGKSIGNGENGLSADAYYTIGEHSYEANLRGL